MNTDIRSYRDLRVWQAGMDLVQQVYEVTQSFPKCEMFGLASQIQRAAVSIPSNIAEGHTREHGKEYLNHLSIAQGSLAELQTQLEIAGRLKYIGEQKVSEVLGATASLAKQIYSLRNALQRSLLTSTQHPAPNTK